MIRTIGFQNILTILVLILFLAGLVIYGLYGLKPSIQEAQNELKKNTTEIAEMRETIDQLIAGIEKFTLQKDTFEIIGKFGFFDPQSRSETRLRIEDMQRESKLLAAKFSINPAQTESNEKAAEAGYKIINTDLEFTLEAVEDSDIYNFVYLLNYGFPGQILIQSFDIERKKEITQPLLRQIGVGEAELIVVGRVIVNWKTMVPDSSIAVTDTEGGSN